MAWEGLSLSQIITSLDLSAGQTAKDTNLRTRALGYALSLQGWDGELVARSRVSLIALGGPGKEECCLQWKGECLNVVGASFSQSLLSGAPVDIRTQSGAECMPPRIRERNAVLVSEVEAAVQAFVLKRGPALDHPSQTFSRPRI